MNKNIMRLIIHVLVLIFAVQTVPMRAGKSQAPVRTLNSYISQNIPAWNKVAKPLALFGIAGAVLGSIWLANKYLRTQATANPAQINNVGMHNQQPAHVLPFYSRLHNWLNDRLSSLIHFRQHTAQQVIPAHQNPTPPPQPEDPLANLTRQIRAPVEGFRPATDERLAIVPYLEDVNNLVVEPIHFDNPDDNAHITIKQANVVDQFDNQDINGEASCGYQAIKNDCGLTGLIKGQNSGMLLTDLDATAQLLGADPQGRFREMVDHRNKKLALRRHLINQLIPLAPRDPAEGEDVANMRIAYTRLLERFLDQQITIVEQGREVDINEHSIIDYMQQAPIPERNTAATAFIRNPQNIARYINLQDPIHLTREDDFDNAITNYNDALDAEDPQHEHIPANGELIQSNEIEYIINTGRQEQGSLLSTTLGNTPVIILDSTERPAPGVPSHIELHETTNLLQHNIHDHILPPERLYTFIINSGDQAKRTPGHWIAMTLEIANGNRRYTIADSAGDHNLYSLLHGSASNVIHFIEGAGIGQLLHSERQSVHEAAQNLNTCLINYEKENNQQNKTRLKKAMRKYKKLKGKFKDFRNGSEMKKRINEALNPAQG